MARRFRIFALLLLAAAALTVPALADYCERIKRLSKPTVKVFNFTNPAGVVSQALHDMAQKRFHACASPHTARRKSATASSSGRQESRNDAACAKQTPSVSMSRAVPAASQAG